MVLEWFYPNKKRPLQGIYHPLSSPLRPHTAILRSLQLNDKSRGFTTDHGETMQVRRCTENMLKVNDRRTYFHAVGRDLASGGRADEHVLFKPG